MKKEKELLISGIHFDYKIPFFLPFINQPTKIKHAVKSMTVVCSCTTYIPGTIVGRVEQVLSTGMKHHNQ